MSAWGTSVVARGRWSVVARVVAGVACWWRGQRSISGCSSGTKFVLVVHCQGGCCLGIVAICWSDSATKVVSEILLLLLIVWVFERGRMIWGLLLLVDPAATCPDRGRTLILLTCGTTEIVDTCNLLGFRSRWGRRRSVILVTQLVLLGAYSLRSVRLRQERTILIARSWLVHMWMVNYYRRLMEKFRGQQGRHKLIRRCMDILHMHTKVGCGRRRPAFLSACSVVATSWVTTTFQVTANELVILMHHLVVIVLLKQSLSLALRFPLGDGSE